MSPENYSHGDTSWFVRDRFGLFIHWGLYALAARHEWVKTKEQLSTEDYDKYFRHFAPDLYDAREWARAAKRAGMKYAVMTTKHHDGFCLFDSAFTDYKATNTPAGRDLIREYVEAFRAEGLRVGFYYSLIDWHHPEFPVDGHHPQRNDTAAREQSKHRRMPVYAEYMRNQVRELLTNYGQIDVIWCDFSYPGPDGKDHDDWESEKLLAVIRECAPTILINNRLNLPGAHDFVTPEQFQPARQPKDASGQPIIWEACQTFSGSWGYYRDEHSWKSVEQLLWMLIDGVSKGGNLLLNVGPTARGEFDYRALERLSGLGEWMHHHSRAIYHCGPAPDEFVAPPDCRYTFNPEKNRLYVHLLCYPFGHVHLPGLADRVDYAQFLHDGSEVQIQRTHGTGGHEHDNVELRGLPGALTLAVPTPKPPPVYPVIELFLK